MQNYSDLFKKATAGSEPFPYQAEVAREVPDLLRAPTGAGKTAAAILGWLWRRRYAPTDIRAATPRRLVYCLPMRVLVEQTRDSAILWLQRLGLLAGTATVKSHDGKERVARYELSWADPEKIAVVVLMGGEKAEDWDIHPERDMIIIGTQDMLLSRALNRGYAMSRYRWPTQFGLLNNDCLWVFDEVQLMGNGLATATQLEGLRGKLLACGCKSLWMSATLQRDWLRTVDFAERVDGLREMFPSDAELGAGELGKRWKAPKPLQKACVSAKDGAAAIAKEVLKNHWAGSFTLVVANTVYRAARLFGELDRQVNPSHTTGGRQRRGAPASPAATSGRPDLVLLHSRFRPPERDAQMQRLLSPVPDAGRIVVATQVVEAGVDISAKTLFTELAPWPSLVQRFGRCNCFGEHADARVFWIDVPTDAKKSLAAPYTDAELEAGRALLRRPHGDDDPDPYTDAELEAARAELQKLADATPSTLKTHLDTLNEDQRKRLFPYSPSHVVRRKDLIELFDTTPDLAGNDIDVSRFIREGEDLDVHVFWRYVPPEGPEPDIPGPARDELCPVPVRIFGKFLEQGNSAYRWDFLAERWVTVSGESVFPGQTYLVPAVPANAGGYTCPGYTCHRGWDKDSAGQVPIGSPDAEEMDANDRDRQVRGDWQSIAAHTEEAVAEVRRLLEQIGLAIPSDLHQPLLAAARWHDRGKAHPIFQGATPDGAPTGGPWAKAPAKLKKYDRPRFRHELAGALAMLDAGLPDLACYLAAAHHGKVRLSIRSLPHEKRPSDPEARFARGVWEGDVLPAADLGGGEVAPEVRLSLEAMELGLSADGKPSWAERMLRLRDDKELGPFRLAFLEAILRAADVRVSAAHAARSAAKEDTHA